MTFSTVPQTSLVAASLALTACFYPVNVGESSESSSDVATPGSTTDPTTSTSPTTAGSTTGGSEEDAGTTTPDDGVHSTLPLDPDVCITPSAECDDACRANCGDPGEVCEGQVLATALIAEGSANEVNVSDLLITPEGDIVVAGNYTGAPDLGLGPLPAPEQGPGAMFVVRHDPDGRPIGQASFDYDAWPRLLRMRNGKLFTVSGNTTADTRIHEFTASPTLEPRDIIIGGTYAVASSTARDEIYFVGSQCDFGGGLMIGRYDGVEATVVYCTSEPGPDEIGNMVGVAVLPSGDLALAGNTTQDITDLGIDYPDGEVAQAAFLVTIEPLFVPTSVTTIKHSMLLAEPGSPVSDGVQLGSLLWSGNYLIAGIQASGNITTGFNEPFVAAYSSDLLAAFTPELEGVGVLSTGVWGVYETAADCAGNVLASVVLRVDDDAPPFGLATTKEHALAVVKIRSDAQTPLDPTPIWSVVDAEAGTVAEDRSSAPAIATTADRILIAGDYRGGAVQLPSMPPLPALAAPQSAAYLLELTP